VTETSKFLKKLLVQTDALVFSVGAATSFSCKGLLKFLSTHICCQTVDPLQRQRKRIKE